VDVHQAILNRRMVRSFDGDPVDSEILAAIVADATRAPSAGNTGGTAWLSLTGPEETARYWDRTTTAEWREHSRRWTGLARAPAILLSLCRPDAYVLRYGEPDKAGSGLGPVPQGEGGGGGLAGPLLVRGCRIRDDARPARPHRGGTRCLLPGQLPRRATPPREPRRARRLATLRRDRSRPSRRVGPPLAVSQPTSSGLAPDARRSLGRRLTELARTGK